MSVTLRFLYKGRTVMVGPVSEGERLEAIALRVLGKENVAVGGKVPKLIQKGRVLHPEATAGSALPEHKILLSLTELAPTGLQPATQQAGYFVWKLYDWGRGTAVNLASFSVGFCQTMFSPTKE